MNPQRVLRLFLSPMERTPLDSRIIDESAETQFRFVLNGERNRSLGNTAQENEQSISNEPDISVPRILFCAISVISGLSIRALPGFHENGACYGLFGHFKPIYGGWN